MMIEYLYEKSQVRFMALLNPWQPLAQQWLAADPEKCRRHGLVVALK
jgi:hypothetical protein